MQERWSIVYVADAKIFSIGPFDREELALIAAIKAAGEDPAGDREFDINDQHVYLLRNDHTFAELFATDVVVCEQLVQQLIVQDLVREAADYLIPHWEDDYAAHVAKVGQKDYSILDYAADCIREFNT